MKKAIVALILVLVLVIGGGVYYLFTNLDSIIKAAIEQYGSEATHTAVRVKSVKTDLPKGSIAIRGLSIANPKGYDIPNAFALNSISTAIDLKSLQQPPYIVNEIVIDAAQVFVELNKDKKTNLYELKQNLTAGSSAPAKTKAEIAEKNKAGDEPRIIIRRIVFTQGNIQAKIVMLNKDLQLKLPRFVLTDLGGKHGATPTELAKEILHNLTEQAREAVKTQGIDKELDKLKAKAKAKIDAEKAKIKEKVDIEKIKAKQKIIDKKAKLNADKDAKLEAEKQKAKDKLKGLFN